MEACSVWEHYYNPAKAAGQRFFFPSPTPQD
jgi:hypothetical protein